MLPFLIFIGFWIFLMNQVQGGGSKVMSFGKSRAKRLSVDSPKITFRDVAGVDEAVEELHEIKEFLENPKKFQALGARIPKGVLLYGPPGTGKTLLARAVAGEAGVPFFSISGSDFVEMFVGVGASRVRDLFEQAKQNSPCIIFMDEIDAVGRHRGAGLGGGHDEREQTLNQLLVEMDGFEMKDNIILIAATNRPDILDPALLRPGRFDRQIVVDRPDRKGRAKILEVHTRGKPLGKEIDVDTLAGQTPGFTGADLSNLVNEAALLSARNGKREITQVELEEGIMRVIAGPEKKTRVMGEKERLITAYHEMGHAIVGHFLEHSDPVHKISIISRGQALGYTISMPQEDKFLTTRAELTDNMSMTLGGRAAEEIVFGEITTGASNDLEKVTATAKQMVMRFGMSERLGPRVFGHDHGQPFLGREFSSEPDYSDEIAREIDDEIRRIVESAHQRAKDILTERREALTTISEILLKRETIEKGEFEGLLAGKAEEEVFGPGGVRQPARCARRVGARAPQPATSHARCPARGWPAAASRRAGSTCPRSPSWPSRRPSFPLRPGPAMCGPGAVVGVRSRGASGQIASGGCSRPRRRPGPRSTRMQWSCASPIPAASWPGCACSSTGRCASTRRTSRGTRWAGVCGSRARRSRGSSTGSSCAGPTGGPRRSRTPPTPTAWRAPSGSARSSASPVTASPNGSASPASRERPARSRCARTGSVPAVPVRLWSPAAAEPDEPLPLLVVHDGSAYDELSGADELRRGGHRLRPAAAASARAAGRPRPRRVVLGVGPLRAGAGRRRPRRGARRGRRRGPRGRDRREPRRAGHAARPAPPPGGASAPCSFSRVRTSIRASTRTRSGFRRYGRVVRFVRATLRERPPDVAPVPVTMTCGKLRGERAQQSADGRGARPGGATRRACTSPPTCTTTRRGAMRCIRT